MGRQGLGLRHMYNFNNKSSLRVRHDMQYFVDCTFVYNNTDDSIYNTTITYKYQYECLSKDLIIGLITLCFIFTPGLLFVYHIRRGLLKSRFTHSLIMFLSPLIVATFPLLNFVVRVNISKTITYDKRHFLRRDA